MMTAANDGGRGRTERGADRQAACDTRKPNPDCRTQIPPSPKSRKSPNSLAHYGRYR